MKENVQFHGAAKVHLHKTPKSGVLALQWPLKTNFARGAWVDCPDLCTRPSLITAGGSTEQV